MRNTLKSLAKSILISSRLTAATFAVDTVIRKKTLRIEDDNNNLKKRDK